uniref:Uncharacterized protein n=1 Tax=uncultured Desulfobacterales bacterium HF0200_07G10 TaxID=710741 RepID=E0XU34_9BACT|nr:hypothetical protein [uncultured Desulfobacterales bacterium HF0200_07G10]
MGFPKSHSVLIRKTSPSHYFFINRLQRWIFKLKKHLLELQVSCIFSIITYHSRNQQADRSKSKQAKRQAPFFLFLFSVTY